MILVALCLIATVGLHAFLVNPKLNNSLHPKIKHYLSKYAYLEGDLGEISIDLLGRVRFSELSLKSSKSSPVNISAKLEGLSLEYSFLSLIWGNPEIVEVEIEGLDLDIEHGLEDRSDPQETADESMQDVLKVLVRLLNEVPSYRLDRIAIQNSRIKVRLSTLEQSILFDTGNFNTEGFSIKDSDSLSVKLKAKIGEEAGKEALLRVKPVGPVGVDLKLPFVFGLTHEILLEKKDNVWKISKLDFQQDLESPELDFVFQETSENLKLQMSPLGQSSSLFLKSAPGPQHIFPLDIRGRIKQSSNHLNALLYSEKSQNKLSLSDSIDLSISGRFNDFPKSLSDLQLKSSGVIETSDLNAIVDGDSHSFKDQSLSLKAKLEDSRVKVSNLNFKLASFKSSVIREKPLDANIGVSGDLDLRSASFKVDLQLSRIPNLSHRPVHIVWLNSSSIEEQGKTIKNKGHIALADKTTLSYDLALLDMKNKAVVHSKLGFYPNIELEKILPDITQLKKEWGSVSLILNGKSVLHHQKMHLSEVGRVEDLQSDSDWSFKLVQNKIGRSQLSFKPIDGRLSVKQSGLSLNSKLSFYTSMSIPNTIEIRSVRALVSSSTSDLKSLKELKFESSCKLRGIRLPKIEQEIGLPQRSAKINAQATLRDQSKIEEFKIDAQLGKKWAHAYLAGRGNLRSQFAAMKGYFGLDTAGKSWRFKDSSIKGSIQVPYLLSYQKNGDISLETMAVFKQFDYRSPDLEIDGLNGKIGANELLHWDGDRLDFAYKEPFDSFRRVDYDRFLPYLPQHYGLKIHQIRSKQHQLGPFQANVRIRQNLILVPRFGVELFGGHLAGAVHMDAHPKHVSLAMLARLSGLDTSLLGSNSDQTALIEGTTALTLDVQQSLLKGKVDVTKIGSKQLRRFIDLLDPLGEDGQMQSAKEALGLAYPEKVNLSFRQGLMDFKVRVNALPRPITKLGLPISHFVRKLTEPIRKALDEINTEST